MSNSTKRRLDGISQPLVTRQLPPRRSRHGKLLTEAFIMTVPAVTERKVVKNTETDQYEVHVIEVSPAYKRPMTLTEIQERRQVRVAAGPTSTYGKTNKGDGITRVKKEK